MLSDGKLILLLRTHVIQYHKFRSLTNFMTTYPFIEKLLETEQPMDNNPTRLSTLILLLKSARHLSGRNLKNGDYEMNELTEENFINQTYHSFQLSGLLNYLILLEQIGSIFTPLKKNIITNSNGIYRALTYFSNLGDTEKQSIKALRNSLAHSFGLATDNTKKEKFKFSLSIESNTDIIRPKNWTGNYIDKSEESITTVFIIDLINLIEDIFRKVNDQWKSGQLKTFSPDEIDKLKARYTLIL